MERPSSPALLGLIFGVVFSAYFGHFSVSSAAQTLLQRDPSGRSLLWGCIAAQASAMLLYMFWVVAINGSIAPQALANLPGTVLVPLAALIGPVANVCGVLLAILAMGMTSIHISLALYFTVREWFPNQLRHALTGFRSWLSFSPLLLVFVMVEALLAINLDSFPQLLAFRGVITVAVIAGVFPVLLLLASRRKGEHQPGLVLPFLGHPLIVGTIYLIAMGSLFLYGLFIWQDPFQKAVALLVGIVVLTTTLVMIRQGAFAHRLVIEIRQDTAEEGATSYSVMNSGLATTQTNVRLDYSSEERIYLTGNGVIPDFPALDAATFHILETNAQELKVWLHRVTPEGYSQQLPAFVKVSTGQETREYSFDEARKQFVIPLQEMERRAPKAGLEQPHRLAVTMLPTIYPP